MAICKTCQELKKLLAQAQAEAERDRVAYRERVSELSLELEKMREIHGTDDGADAKYN